MTTKVLIVVPRDNHQSVRIDIGGPNGVMRSDTPHVTLDEGEERLFYVYAGQSLRVSEVPKGLGARERVRDAARLDLIQRKQFLD